MTGLRLNVRLNFGMDQDIDLARLGWDPTARQAVGEWDKSFTGSPLPISPLLIKAYDRLLRPRGRAFGDLPGLFGDSLPDGWGRLLIDRELAASGYKRDEITDLHRLARVGKDGMGALTYRPEQTGAMDHDVSIDWFDRLVLGIDGQTSLEDLERLRRMAGGSQGARPKFVAQLSDDGTRLKGHQLPHEIGWRHVLLKRRALSDGAGAIEAEVAYAAMAVSAGITMAPIALMRATSGEPFLVTERFDRLGAERRHMQTVAALLDVDFRTATMDYLELIKVVRLMTRDQRAIEQMFRRMVFNIRCWNRDDHLKNHAFLMNPKGIWELSPAYDLSFSRGPGGEHTLLVAGEGRRPGPDHILQVAKVAGIKLKRASQIIDEVDAVVHNWPSFARTAEVPQHLTDEISNAMGHARLW